MNKRQLVRWRENGFVFEDTCEIGVPRSFLRLASSEVDVDKANGCIIHHEAGDNSSLIPVYPAYASIIQKPRNQLFEYQNSKQAMTYRLTVVISRSRKKFFSDCFTKMHVNKPTRLSEWILT